MTAFVPERLKRRTLMASVRAAARRAVAAQSSLSDAYDGTLPVLPARRRDPKFTNTHPADPTERERHKWGDARRLGALAAKPFDHAAARRSAALR